MLKKSPHFLDVSGNLPPGTDYDEEILTSPRLPRKAAQPWRPLPAWPHVTQRKGRWITQYLDKLDPETEFDQIIRTSSLFGMLELGTLLAYTVIICINSQAPAGAAAVHGGSVVKQGHARYYRTLLSELNWVFHGSTAPETAADIARINKIHATVWNRRPGTFYSTWEGKMTIVGISCFDTWVRKVVGAIRQAPHPKIQLAYPLWGEQLTAHFHTETSHGSQSFGNNYPRDWNELQAFFTWLIDFPYEEQINPEQRRVGSEVAESFIAQFCEFWFPSPLQFLGRNIVLTFIPPKCRQRQGLGEPSRFLSTLIKLSVKIYLDISDFILSDPAEPLMLQFRNRLMDIDPRRMDAMIKESRCSQGRAINYYLLASIGIFTLIVVLQFSM